MRVLLCIIFDTPDFYSEAQSKQNMHFGSLMDYLYGQKE